jgi:hypothetical protein
MILKLAVISLSIASSLANASTCGSYLVDAKVVMKNGLSSLVINPGTKSEINLKVEFNESAKLSPYIDRFIETNVRIEEKMDYTRGVVASLGAITTIVPDPLAPSSGTKFQLLKKEECKKK